MKNERDPGPNQEQVNTAQGEANTAQGETNAAQARANASQISQTDSLRQEVEALSTAVLATSKSIKRTLEQYSTRDEIQTARRRTVAASITAVLLAVSLGFLVNNWAITHCFFRPSPHENSFCDRILPGYNEAVVRSRERSLNSSNRSKENRERIEELERELDTLNQTRIEELERELDALQSRLGSSG